MKYQATTSHPDPIHVTAHFLRATTVGSFEVHVRNLRTGKSFTNISADLIQDVRQQRSCRELLLTTAFQGIIKITTHSVFGVLDPGNVAPSEATAGLKSSSSLRVTPFFKPPSQFRPHRNFPRWNYREYLSVHSEPSVKMRHQDLSKTKYATGGMESGMWMQLAHPSEKLTPKSLTLFSDLFPGSLPTTVIKDVGRNWFLTVVISIEFKAPIPRDSSMYSLRTVGVFVSSRFINDPQARHDVCLELWTAPCDFDSEKDLKADWRQQQQCLAVAHQTALVLPMSVNKRRGQKVPNTSSAKL